LDSPYCINLAVDILFGYIGTPTTKRIMGIIEKTGIPFLFPFTGATFLRTPVKRNVFNIRASYEDETYNMVRYLIGQGKKRIAVFYQDDAYGHTGLAGVKKALEEYNLDPVAEGIYIRNTTAVRSAVVKIYLANPDAVILVGTSPACAKFIREYKNLAGTENTLFLNISFVGTKSLYGMLGEKYSKNVLFSEVVPFPWDDMIPVVAEYLSLLNRYFPGHEPGWVSLEGFIAAKVTVEALKIALKETGGKFDRKTFLRVMENLNVDIGGLKVSFSPENHQAFKNTWLIKYEDGEYKQVGRVFFGYEIATEENPTGN
jgi:ABC-type branched-subunit amino acid transport system substrate-binding protein